LNCKPFANCFIALSWLYRRQAGVWRQKSPNVDDREKNPALSFVGSGNLASSNGVARAKILPFQN
jgi:hypothetical protein